MTTAFPSVAILSSLGVWVWLFASYLVLAGQADAAEVVAGAICAGLAAVWWFGACRTSDHSFAVEVGAGGAVWRACRKLPWATGRVAVALLRAPFRRETGGVGRRPYAHGRVRDPLDGGRRAVGVLAASLAPDSFVVRVPVDRDEIIMHGLVPSEPASDARWPI